MPHVTPWNPDIHLQALDDEWYRRRFVDLLLALVAEACPARNDRRVLFPFRRTFVIAHV